MIQTTEKPLTFGSLFAGIGGFDLGFERAGMVCKWQVEIDGYCQKVLAKHWPNVRRHDDVKTWPLPDAERVDVICGGFPCQDISGANPKGKGLAGERSGLWNEFQRIVGVLRPRFVVVENSPRLIQRGLSRVLGDLAELGYGAEWSVVSACSVGAPHMRKRLFIIADTDSESFRMQKCCEASGATARVQKKAREWERLRANPRAAMCNLGRADVSSTVGSGDGISSWSHRMRALGNAVVPQVAEKVGRRVIDLAK